MTVIAYDGNLLVADGRATKGTSLVTDKEIKLHKIRIAGLGKCILGTCGALEVMGPWLEQLEKEGIGKQLEHSLVKDDEGSLDARALMITERSECFEITTNGGYFAINSPYSIGSGSYYAQHFLLTGHDAITAVKEACKSELTCGGEIAVYDIKKKTFYAG